MGSYPKRFAETLLIRSGIVGLARRLRRPYALVLAYHNVVPDSLRSIGDRSLHLPRREFVAQLEALTRTCQVVPLDGIVGARPRSGKPLAAITFDDGYRGALTSGLEELASRGLPATFFVAPQYLGGKAFWWDLLADSGTGEVAARTRQQALENLRGAGDAVLGWARAVSLTEQQVSADCLTASEADLRRAASVPGITFGSHSWSHPNLARLAPPAVEAELAESLSWLRRRFEMAIPWLAYPYGLSSPGVEAAAARAGYKAAVLIRGGILGASPRPFAVPRINIPAAISRHGFELRLSALALS